MKKITKIFLIIPLFIFVFFVFQITIASTRKSPEIYFTNSNATDPFDKNFEISEIEYGKSFNLVGENFSVSKDVHIYLNQEYIGVKEIEDGKFRGIMNIKQEEAENKTYSIKVDGAARGETLEKEIYVKLPSVIPSWAYIIVGLIVIGCIVYFIYLKIFQE